MKTLKYLRSNSTSKNGVNYLRSIAEYCNCIFNEIDTQNDLGIDGIIEIIRDERPIAKLFAVQIKSGGSYYQEEKDLCKIPIDNHYDYWINYSLPLYGIVYIPKFNNAYWVNIKKYLEDNPNSKTIYFERTRVNEISQNSFSTIFILRIMNMLPDISFDFALELFNSKKVDEFTLGLTVLFKKYGYKVETIDYLINFFRREPIEVIPLKLVHYLAYCPWHPDISYSNDTITEEVRKYGRKLISEFTKSDVIKLLYFIDDEEILSRGSIGQSVEVIISTINNCDMYLNQIILDEKLDVKIREFSAVIFAYRKGVKSLPVLKNFHLKSDYISMLIKHIERYGSFNPYS